MSREEFDESVAHARLHFEEGLIRAGFREEAAGWCGSLPRGDGSVEISVSIGRGFPFEPPRVRPNHPASAPWSWHRELDGSLCLVGEDDRDGLWWREAEAFLEHVTAWFNAADSGWPDDRPDLDIDRYFQKSQDPRLYLLPALDPFDDSYARFRRGDNDTMVLASHMEKPSQRRKRFRFDRFGYVAWLRDLYVPPRSWEDVAKVTQAGIDLDQAVRAGKVDLLVLRYERAGQPGAIALDVRMNAAGGIEMRRLVSASTDAGPWRIRSGPYAAQLAGKRVAVVGLGAVGSYVADMLVRAGVRRLTLLDGDVLRPGNVVRHLLDSTAVGLRKAEGVAAELLRRHGVEKNNIHARGDLVLTNQSAYELLASHDLVINATAEYPVTALLHAAADAEGLHFLSVALQNDGETLRVDVLPPLSGESLRPSDNPPSAASVPNFEAGCGSPISPTPPFAVTEAAAVAARHAVGMLVGRPLHPAGEVRHLNGQGD